MDGGDGDGDVGLERRGKMEGLRESGWAFGAQPAAPLHEQAAALRELLAGGVGTKSAQAGKSVVGV